MKYPIESTELQRKKLRRNDLTPGKFYLCVKAFSDAYTSNRIYLACYDPDRGICVVDNFGVARQPSSTGTVFEVV